MLNKEADRHVLALAIERSPSILITGDRRLANKAEVFGIVCLIPPRIVQMLAEAGVVPAARPHLDQMRQIGFGIPDEVYDDILRTLEE